VKVKFQADNDLDRTIVRGLLRRLPGADFQSEPLTAVEDFAVLQLAAQAGRIVVSHDVKTMPPAFAEYRRTGHSPGVLVTPQLWPLADAIEHLVLIWELTDASEWQDRICYLPTFADFRIPE
jgi:Domain of unknown function (DUF5615)